jgi:hypothetical protein
MYYACMCTYSHAYDSKGLDRISNQQYQILTEVIVFNALFILSLI